MSQTLLYLLNALAPIVTFFFVLRFLLQASQADFYNPISQGVVAITDPVLKPLRMLIPNVGRWNFSALVAAVLLEGLFGYAEDALMGQPLTGFLQLTIEAIFSAIAMILTVLRYMILISIVASLLAAFGGLNIQHPILSLLNQIIDPIMEPARRLIPPMGGLDFSPILVIVLLGVLSDSILPQLRDGLISIL